METVLITVSFLTVFFVAKKPGGSTPVLGILGGAVPLGSPNPDPIVNGLTVTYISG